MSLTGPTQRPLTTRRVRVRSVRDVSRHHMERVTGIEPAFSAWEADVLPLNYTREQTCTIPLAGCGRHCDAECQALAGGH